MKKSTKLGLTGTVLGAFAVMVGLNDSLTAIFAETVLIFSAAIMIGVAGIFRENNK